MHHTHLQSSSIRLFLSDFKSISVTSSFQTPAQITFQLIILIEAQSKQAEREVRTATHTFKRGSELSKLEITAFLCSNATADQEMEDMREMLIISSQNLESVV